MAVENATSIGEKLKSQREEIRDDRVVVIPLDDAMKIWKAIETIATSLAQLGSLEAIPPDGFDAERVMAQFIHEFNVGRKLGDARRLLNDPIEEVLGSDKLAEISERYRGWRWKRPANEESRAESSASSS